ncbi:MAG TPA: DUF362 domain-containing protein [Symbiobacteriaceae bacterium]|nr:DUF362 domain-containing protein [Symbiobacteriaceae bacterium]
MPRPRRVAESAVAITRNPLEGDAIREALDLLPAVVSAGDTVVVTPNWVNDKEPDTGTVVGPESLRQLLRWVQAKKPRRLVVACGSAHGNTPAIMEKTGYARVIAEEGAEFVDLNGGPYVVVELEHNLVPATPLNRLAVENDVLISYTQIKHHREATISCGIKNVALSWPPTEFHGTPKMEMGIHRDLHGFINAMARALPIDLTILSTDKAMIGTGPSEGLAVDGDLVVAGTDPVATDVVGARLLGFLPQAVHYLYRLAIDGVGEGDVRRMRMLGVPLHEAEAEFAEKAYGKRFTLDKPDYTRRLHEDGDLYA